MPVGQWLELGKGLCISTSASNALYHTDAIKINHRIYTGINGKPKSSNSNSSCTYVRWVVSEPSYDIPCWVRRVSLTLTLAWL